MKNRKYCVGIIGAGGIARVSHLPGWKKLPDVTVLAAADVSKNARESAAREFEIPDLFEDYHDLLKMEEIDIVDICAPNAVHYPAAVAALQAGKHVLCEKPLATSAVEAEGMIRAAKRARRKLMTAQHMRFKNESRAVKNLIDQGAFGEIYYVIAYALRRRYLPPSPTFIRKEISGGGPLLDIGVHILDLVYWFMGCPKVRTVKGATYAKLAKRKDIRGLWGEWDRRAYNVEDFAAGLVTFATGASISLSCSFLANMETLEDFSASLFGTEAGIHWPDGKIATEKNRVLQNIELRTKELPALHPHHEEIRLFLECVKEDKEVPVKAAESLEVIKMLEGIYKSARTGREVVF